MLATAPRVRVEKNAAAAKEAVPRTKERRVSCCAPGRGKSGWGMARKGEAARSGRHGQAWTADGPLTITNARFADDPSPLDRESECPASRDYSKAYLHHLFKAGEYLGPMLLTWHNLHYYQQLMADLRAAIAEGRLGAFIAEFRRRTGVEIL